MAEQELHVVELRDEFYRDSFGKVVTIIIGFIIAIAFLVALSIYLFLDKPPPVSFHVDGEWRVRAPVPLDQPYLSRPDLLQWVTNVLPKAFIFDFNHYNAQLKEASQYFTADGWKGFLDQLNIYANYNNMQAYKLFVSASPSGAPAIINEGLLSGRYAWWVQIPMNINYAGYSPPPNKALTLQVLVVRVSTLNNLMGVGINNVVVVKGAANNQLAEMGKV
jgi:intracellular multiplication protein IcmL